jgi:hypothetical protein
MKMVWAYYSLFVNESFKRTGFLQKWILFDLRCFKTLSYDLQRPRDARHYILSGELGSDLAWESVTGTDAAGLGQRRTP